MKSRKFGFFSHYRKIRIEGSHPVSVVNKCIKNGIPLKNLKWKTPLESTMEVQGEDFEVLRKLTGNSYRLTVLKEGGALPLFRNVKANLLTVAGAFFLGAFLFYQSLFVAEIRIDGYRTVTEDSLRQTLKEEGLYEGAKKEEDYRSVKARLYQEYENITWVSIFQEGRLVKVQIAEADRKGTSAVAEDKPAHIVADRSGMIEKILPLQGNAVVQKGDYVNEGDVLISGKYRYQSTDYRRGDKVFTLYRHAKGQVLARVPKQMTYYFEKTVRTKEPTGRECFALSVKMGDGEVKLGESGRDYEASVRSETVLLDWVKPVPMTVKLIKTREVSLKEEPRKVEEMKLVVEAALRQYAKENLGKDERILNQTIEFYEEENLVRANVILELLQEIGAKKALKQ